VSTLTESNEGQEGSTLTRLYKSAFVAIAAAAVLLLIPVSAWANDTVKIRDDCDPTTFNAAVPGTPPTCVGKGHTTFANFRAQLVDHKFAAKWRFSPDRVKIKQGRSLHLDNRGGETHTFTEVSSFEGGGIVPFLNQILFGTETPPTFFIAPLSFIPTGGADMIDTGTLSPGPHMFICAIHSWMHETVVVKAEKHDDD